MAPTARTGRTARTAAAAGAARAASRPGPELRTFELLLGYGCNAKCGFCYNPPLTPELLSKDIPFKDAVALLYRARLDGYAGVWFTGGDPTLRKDLPRLLAASRRLGFERIQIGTNAVRLAQPAYTRRLVAAGLNYARVSLHAASAPLHDALLEMPGAFDAAIAAIRQLQAAGVYVGLNFVVTSRNYRELPAFFSFCIETLGIRDFDVIFSHYRGMMEINAAALGVRYSDAVPYLREAFKVYDRLGHQPGTPTLINIPPCAAPELRPWTADWSVESTGDLLAQPGGAGVDLHAMKSGQRMKAPSCAGCALDARCLGFEREYAARFGVADFKPVAAA